MLESMIQSVIESLQPIDSIESMTESNELVEASESFELTASKTAISQYVRGVVDLAVASGVSRQTRLNPGGWEGPEKLRIEASIPPLPQIPLINGTANCNGAACRPAFLRAAPGLDLLPRGRKGLQRGRQARADWHSRRKLPPWWRERSARAPRAASSQV